MANQLGSDKLRRLFSAIVVAIFAFLVIVTTVVPHSHDCSCVRSSIAHSMGGYIVTVDPGSCPLCEWQALAFAPVSSPVVAYHAPIVSWKPVAQPMLVRLFGIVEPLHSPQRGPPSILPLLCA